VPWKPELCLEFPEGLAVVLTAVSTLDVLLSSLDEVTRVVLGSFCTEQRPQLKQLAVCLSVGPLGIIAQTEFLSQHLAACVRACALLRAWLSHGFGADHDW
jgi:hypothetical protein